MRHIFKIAVLLSFWTSISYSFQNEQDSISYYINLAKYKLESNSITTTIEEYHSKAIKLANLENNKEILADVNYRIGINFFNENRYNLALPYFVKASFYSTNIDNINAKKAKYNAALGDCYSKLKKGKLATLYFNKAQKLYSTINVEDSGQLINFEKALLYIHTNKTSKAKEIFEEIIADEKSLDYVKTESFFILTQHFIKTKKLPLAIETLKKMEAYAESKNGINKNIIYLNLAECYQKTKHLELANFYLQKLISSEKNIIRNEVTTKDIDTQLEFIEKFEKEKQSQLKSIRFSKLISIMSISLISILSLLSYSLYKNNKLRNETNKLLKEKNRELFSQKEKAEMASKARADFLSTVSHELRTPLNAINGITYLLLQENPKESQLEYLKSLEFSGNYLLSYINDILEINRLDSKNIEVEKIPFNLTELIQNINRSFQDFIKKNRVEFITNIQLDGSTSIIGDPTKLSQILINLINNAIKFTVAGKVELFVKKVTEDDNFVKIYFEISDNGIGIAEEKQKAIFDSFTQGSISINRNYGGTGLGLSIVKKLIDLFNSEIHLDSKENVGSKFYFAIEFEKSKITSEPIPISSEVDFSVFKSKKVLLVEDNKINQMITQKMVENRGMSCTIIDNGEEAIQLMKNNNYDLVLMDVHLPGINGTEATKQIRLFDNATPIIALTAISLDENREQLLSFGMNDVVTKPFDTNHFYLSIYKLIKD